MELGEARAQLQRALNLSHPVQTARYLTVAAAACLNHGLQKSLSGSDRLLVLLPVAYAQVAEHVKANCPDVSNLLLKLQGKAGSKYFTISKAHVSEPFMVALDVSLMITSSQRRPVSHILANLELAPLAQSNQVAESQPGDLKTATSLSTTQLAPSYSTGSILMSQMSQATRPSSASAVLTVLRPVHGAATHSNSSSDATGARVQLQDAIMKSHGSHTARWLTETAAVCLKHGLTSSTSTGLQLHPIKCTLVTMHIRDVLPELHDVMAKLQSATGLKYFRLFWASQQLDTVLLRLRDIILVPGQPTALANLLRSIEIVDRPIAAPANGHVPPAPARMQPPAIKDTPAAAPSTQRFSVADALSHLKGAVARSHPPTAKYLVETATACLDHGFQATNDAAFVIRPVSWLPVADVVSHHCPHAELLEKLCGRTGQKYFQLLGNTDDGLPEFVLADVHALISSRQSPAVAHILSQMQDRSQPPASGSGPAQDGAGAGQQHASPAANNIGPAQTGKEALISKQPTFTNTAAPKTGSSKGADSSWEDPPPGFAPLSSRGSPDADKPAQPVPAPSSHASGSDAGSSQAMQALLSACKQLPLANDKDLSSGQVKPAAPPAPAAKQQPLLQAPAGNPVSTDSAIDVDAASTLLPGKPLSAVPLSTTKAETSNGVENGVHDKMGGASRSSSSASGMTEAMQARSAASTELSGSSTVSVSTALATEKNTVQDPFCIDCIAQPGNCHRHPLVPPSTSAGPDGAGAEEASLEAAAGSSQCSSQDHVRLDANKPVAVLCFFSDATDGLGKIQLHSENETQTLDLKLSPSQASLAKLKALLENGNIVKVFHDCRQNAEQLYRHHAIKIHNIFDTRVAQAVLDHVQCLMHSDCALRRWSFNELLDVHDVRQTVSENRQNGAGDSDAANDAAALLRLWKVYLTHLGAVGAGVVFKLSQALSDCSHDVIGSAATCSSQHQAQPVNKDLVMTFPNGRSFVPTFTSLDTATIEPNPEAGTSRDDDGAPAESADASIAADPDSELQALLDVLPETVRDAVVQLVKEKQNMRTAAASQEAPSANKCSIFQMLVEIVVDKARPWVVVFRDGTTAELAAAVSIDDAVTALSVSSGETACHPFENDNRAGIDGMLHSVIAIRDRAARTVIGLTFRIGRHVPGAANIILDILAQMQQKYNDNRDSCERMALLIVGKPQTGKTTLLRDIASTMADKFKQRVVVVDTNGELGGDGSVPHHSLRNTRRLPVRSLSRQHEVVLEALHNHKPGVIVVDEINSLEDVQVVQSIVGRGIRVIAGASACTSLASLLTHPDLSRLVRRTTAVGSSIVPPSPSLRAGKSMTSKPGRVGPPPFDGVVEVLDHGKCRFHPDTSASIDALLANKSADTQLRTQSGGKLIVRFEQGSAAHEGGDITEVEWLKNLATDTAVFSKP